MSQLQIVRNQRQNGKNFLRARQTEHNFNTKLEALAQTKVRSQSRAIICHNQLQELSGYNLATAKALVSAANLEKNKKEDDDYAYEPTANETATNQPAYSQNYNYPETWFRRDGTPADPKIVNFDTKYKFRQSPAKIAPGTRF